MTTVPQRRHLPGITSLPAITGLGRRAPERRPVPLVEDEASSIVAWAWYVDGVRRPAGSLTQAARNAQDGRGLRLARPQGPRQRRPGGAVVAVRAAPARHRGRGERPRPLQARDVRRRPVHGRLDRRVRRPRGDDRERRGRHHRAGDDLPRGPLRDHRAARRARPAERAAPVARGGPRAARARSRRRCSTRSPTRSSTTTWWSSTRSRRTSTRSRAPSSPAAARTRSTASTSSSGS